MRKIKFLLILLIPLLLAGCWDRVELEEIGYVVVIGLDKGENNKLRTTFQITNPQISIPTNVKVEEPPSDIITLLSEDIISAKDLANISIARNITFTHTKVIIVSEELAKSDSFFPLIEATLRDRGVRRELEFIVCKEKASEFIKNNKPAFDIRVGKYFEYMTSRWKDVGFVPLSNLHRLAQRTIDNLSLFLASYATTQQETPKLNAENEGDYLAGQVPKEGSNPTQMMGSVVFKKGKMVGKITGDETRMALMLRPKIITNNLLMTVPDPLQKEKYISVKLARKKPKIDINISDEYPIIDVTVPVELSVTAIPSSIDYIENQKNQLILKDSIEKYFENKAMTLVEKTQKEFRGEPFLWSSIARKKFWLLEDFEQYNWMEKYKNASVSINFDVEIKDFGKHIAPFNIKKLEN